jgi:predicted ATP-binding protein involved in virulence
VEAVQRARGDFTFEPSGIVIVDEIETHLHLLLQEQILPFLSEIFPRLQIIVATHSPAVIASISGAVVCDLGTREQALSDHYRGVPYGMLMKDHFGISSDIDLDSTRKLLRLRELAAAPARSVEEERELQALAAELSQRSPVLATEVWMMMERIGGSSVQLAEARS